MRRTHREYKTDESALKGTESWFFSLTGSLCINLSPPLATKGISAFEKKERKKGVRWSLTDVLTCLYSDEALTRVYLLSLSFFFFFCF